MEKLRIETRSQLSPAQIVNDFKAPFGSLDIVKTNMHRIFHGFYISSENDYLDRNQREEISFQFNQVLELISRLDHLVFVPGQDREDLKVQVEYLEATIKDKEMLIELLRNEVKKAKNAFPQDQIKKAPEVEAAGDNH